MTTDDYVDRSALSTSSDDPAVLTQEIDQTRADMTATVDAIQQKLDPKDATDHAKELAEQVLADAKVHAQELMQEAGEHARAAVRDATAHVQGAIHDATIGRVQTMVRAANSKANAASESLLDTIKQNPVPAALAGLSLGWLWMNRRSSASQGGMNHARYGASSQQGYSYSGWDRTGYGGYGGETYGSPSMQGGQSSTGRVGDTMSSAASQVGGVASSVGDRVGNVAGQVGDTAGSMAAQVSGTASQVAGQVGETASNVARTVSQTATDLGQQAQYSAMRLEDRFQTTLRTNPLAVGAVALALGTAVGLVLPSTERENALMGEARDTLFERAQGLAQETMGKVQDVAGEVQTTVQQQAEKQGLTSSGSTGSSS